MLSRDIAVVCCAGLLAMAGYAGERPSPSTAAGADDPGGEKKRMFRVTAVRYQVKDVDRSVAFYTEHLDFKLEQKAGPAFARISNGSYTL